MKLNVVMPPPGEFSKPDVYQMAKQKEQQTSPESTSITNMGKKRMQNFAVGDISFC